MKFDLKLPPGKLFVEEGKEPERFIGRTGQGDFDEVEASLLCALWALVSAGDGQCSGDEWEEAKATALAAAKAAEDRPEDRDSQRWRWLRDCGGWPESEAAMSGATPEEFDAMADAAINRIEASR